MEKFLLEFRGFIVQCHNYDIHNVDYVELFKLYKSSSSKSSYEKWQEIDRAGKEYMDWYNNFSL